MTAVGDDMKDMNISLLIDFYGNLLSERKLEIMKQYYYEDLSLSEIAQNEGMTRQGVHENIRKSAAELEGYEERLRLAEKFKEVLSLADGIEGLLHEGEVLDGKTYGEIISALDRVRNFF